MKITALIVVSFVALGATGAAVVPRGLEAAALFAGPRDEQAVTEYRLAGRSPGQYAVEIETALSAKDEELADSLVTLAGERNIALPADLLGKVERAKAEADARGLEDAWDGFLSGQAPNESALAGSVAADLTGFGDMRDLFQQANRYVDGQEVDSFLVGLAAVGLGLTVATYASDGLLFSARSGVSTIKAAKRAGRLSPALLKHVGVLATDAVDTKAFGVMAASLKSLDLAAARAAAKALVKPQALGRISDLGSDVATIGSKVGYRGTLQTLAVAESAEDVSRVAKLSSRFGKATRGVLVLVGTAITFASVAGTATMWLVTLLIWAGAALMAVAKLALWLGRWLWPRRGPRLRIA